MLECCNQISFDLTRTKHVREGGEPRTVEYSSEAIHDNENARQRHDLSKRHLKRIGGNRYCSKRLMLILS